MKEHFRLCEKLVNRPFRPFCGKQWSWSNGALKNALLVRLLNEFLVVPSRNISIERIRSTGSWLLPLFQFSCRTWELNVCHSISLTGIKISLSRYDQIIQFYLLQVIRLCKSLGIESHTHAGDGLNFNLSAFPLYSSRLLWTDEMCWQVQLLSWVNALGTPSWLVVTTIRKNPLEITSRDLSVDLFGNEEKFRKCRFMVHDRTTK